MRRALAAALAALAALVLAAGCGSAQAHHVAAPSTAALPHVGYGAAGRTCAALNALVLAGTSRHPLRVVQEAYFSSAPNGAAEVAAAVHQRCPQYVHLLPRQYRSRS